MHPKVDVRNMLAKWNENGSVGHSFWEPFGYHFPLKMHIKTNANFNAEKLQTFMRKCSQNHAKTRPKINDKSMKFWNLRFLVFCEEYNVKIVFSHDQGSQKSIKNQQKINANSMLEKKMHKSEKMLQKGARMGAEIEKI